MTTLTERLRASPTSDIMLEAADYIDGLISQHHRDSKELRQLCAERDEARQSALDRGFALLKAKKEARAMLTERDRLRKALQALLDAHAVPSTACKEPPAVCSGFG